MLTEEKIAQMHDMMQSGVASYPLHPVDNEFPWPADNLWSWLAVDHFNHLMLILPLSLLTLICLFIFLRSNPLPPRQKKMREKYFFKWGALIIWLAGVALYIVGFCHEGTKHSPIALLLRASLSSLEMFVSHSDLLEVAPYWKAQPIYMTLFATVHFLAVALSAMFAIRYVGFRILSWLKLKTWTLFHPTYNLYIFFGISEASCLLAKDIKKERKGETNLIIFVDSPLAEEEEQQRLSFSHIFGLFSYRRTVIEKVSGLHAILIHSSASLADGNTTELPPLAYAGLSYLLKLIKKAEKTYLFFLSAEEDVNVKSVIHLINGKEIKGESVKIFCHARKDNRNSVLENNVKVKVIDSSWLSVVALKTQVKVAPESKDGEEVPLARREYANHPIDFVEIDSTRCVADSPFTALVIGFGETGRDALRFLYEFGQFPTSEKVKKGFECYVCDEKMSMLEGRFLMQTPALVDNDSVHLLNLSFESSAFWKQMESIICRLNYVVIAVGNDEKGISLAADLYRFALRHRGGKIGNLRIYVRAYKLENEDRLRSVASYSDQAICLFGVPTEIYTWRNIIDDKLHKMSKAFYDSYCKTNPSSKNKTWDERHKCLMKGDKWDRQSIRRKETQDMANCLHVYTKIKLAGGIDKMRNRVPGTESYTNLAICEHMRWMASHEMMGYIRMSKEIEKEVGEKDSCHEQTKQHKCIVPWHLLSEHHHHNDSAVVNTTIALLADQKKPER